MKRFVKASALFMLPVFLLAACVAYPRAGPSSPAYIGDGKTQAEFAQADAACRDLALNRTGMEPGDAAAQSTAGSAVMGTLLGAALGAAIGAVARNPGLGAAIGAGSGLAASTAQGTAAGAASASLAQQRYDAEYYQCMYAYGHKVLGVMYAPPQQSYMPPPPPPPPPSSAPQYAPPAVPPASFAPPPTPTTTTACNPSGKYVRTTDGYREICQ
jgi:hypothetical protein